jgi:nucleotide-binding universal stress UspA family protein
MTRVLVALDGTDASVRAGRVAVGLFGPTAEFLVLNVAASPVPLQEVTPFGAVVPMAAADWDSFTATLESGAEQTARRGAAEVGIEPAEVVVEHGDPVAAICAAAEDHDVDVVVVGSADKKWFVRLVDPSVADGVVHHTTRPVLVVSGHDPAD